MNDKIKNSNNSNKSTTFSYIIVDDEPIAHRIIQDYAKVLGHLQLMKNCYNAFEAIEFLHHNTVDLIFLDLNMPQLKGFDFLRTLKSTPQVIITTAYEEFALESYDFNISDYLLKPFSLQRFLVAVNKALLKPKVIKDIEKLPSKNQTILIKGDKKYHQLNLSEIYSIEACGNYCLVNINGEEIMTHQKISSFEKSLDKNQFLRVHKSHIVALDKIKSISNGYIRLMFKKVPIGATYKRAVDEFIANKLKGISIN